MQTTDDTDLALLIARDVMKLFRRTYHKADWEDVLAGLAAAVGFAIWDRFPPHQRFEALQEFRKFLGHTMRSVLTHDEPPKDYQNRN